MRELKRDTLSFDTNFSNDRIEKKEQHFELVIDDYVSIVL